MASIMQKKPVFTTEEIKEYNTCSKFKTAYSAYSLKEVKPPLRNTFLLSHIRTEFQNKMNNDIEYVPDA